MGYSLNQWRVHRLYQLVQHDGLSLSTAAYRIGISYATARKLAGVD